MHSINPSLQCRSLSRPFHGQTKIGPVTKSLSKEQEELKEAMQEVSTLIVALKGNVECKQINSKTLGIHNHTRTGLYEQEQDKIVVKIAELSSGLSTLQTDQLKTKQRLEKLDDSLKLTNSLIVKLGEEVAKNTKSIEKIAEGLHFFKSNADQSQFNSSWGFAQNSDTLINKEWIESERNKKKEVQEEYVFLGFRDEKYVS